jgi:ADP-dependent NAD(P)H-hydrate dehydratase / NAD(P)H-hydrate epimerase
VGGSDQYAGCLAFNGLAALRAGADLSIIVAPRRAADIAASYSPDLITAPCATPFPDPRVTEEFLPRADCLIIGCGVARTRVAHNAILSIIKKCKVPIVADAESLHAIASKPNATYGKRILFTPNAGEYEVLARKTWPRSNTARATAARSLARHYRCTVIVKGAEDFISDGTRSHIDRAGSPYMTKGGYGDLLAGVAGALLARGNTPFESAKAAAYIVGRAGEVASRKLGEGMLASDALETLPEVIRQIRR